MLPSRRPCGSVGVWRSVVPVLIGIGIDYGVTGAAVAIGPRRGVDGPHRLAVRHAHGRGGYYAGGRAGSLDVRIARRILQLRN